MDRDRDEPRRLPDRGKGRGLLDAACADPPADKFDPAEFDMPSDPPPSAAGRARGAADAAQAHSFFSHLDTNIQRVLAGFGTIRDLVADVRASLADAAARDAQRAEEEEARDKAIAARLVDPAALEARAEAGARRGAVDGLAGAGETLRRRIGSCG
jgi:hypothetical protein